MSGESRHELVAWLNDLTGLGITKVEQCGRGTVLCHVYDSIWGDVGVKRINYDANNEYQYITNWKILQAAFTRHGIERAIAIDALVKCKMQDNLDFLQFSKRYWDAHYTGEPYDAAARRGGAGPAARPRPTVAPRVSNANLRATRAESVPPPPLPRSANTPLGTRPATSARVSAAHAQQIHALEDKLQDMQESAEGLERERDFYFGKLRELEIIIQEQSVLPDGQKQAADPDSFLSRLSAVLYQTEEGFEVPVDAVVNDVEQLNLDERIDDGETF